MQHDHKNSTIISAAMFAMHSANAVMTSLAERLEADPMDASLLPPAEGARKWALPTAIVVCKHDSRHTSHPSAEAEMEDPHLAALQNQLTDSKRRLAVACTQMSEFAGAFILLIL